MFRSTYVEEQPKVVKKDLGDVKSVVMQDVEDIKCVKKDIERIREGMSKPSHEFSFKLGLFLFLK